MGTTQLARLPLKDEPSLESIQVLKKVAEAHRYLAELKGVAKAIPNEGILLSTLTMQEAKDSSAIENIFTTHDELFQLDVLDNKNINQSAKEVESYRLALWESYKRTQETVLIRFDDILKLQEIIEPEKSGIRKVPGTVIGDSTGNVIYRPPQHPDEITELLSNLIDYMNDDTISNLDPLIKMAVIHHQFESIHPFYDGNGRAGRILNILYLVKNELLDLPILYLSRYIVRTKDTYYDLLQKVREDGCWNEWVVYILEGIKITAQDTILFVQKIQILVRETKLRLRNELPKIYSQELLNNLFFHPYTKVQFLVEQLGVTRITATKYLNQLAEHEFVSKHKVGRTNYYVNERLLKLITEQEQILL